MTKELTDRIKKEIVNKQIKFLKDNYPNELINYNKLEEYLSEALRGYSSKKLEINERVNLKLLRNLQDENSTTAAKLFQTVNNIPLKGDVPDKHLITFYENNKEALMKIKGYGEKTQQLLIDYLIKKGIIN